MTQAAEPCAHRAGGRQEACNRRAATGRRGAGVPGYGQMPETGGRGMAGGQPCEAGGRAGAGVWGRGAAKRRRRWHREGWGQRPGIWPGLAGRQRLATGGRVGRWRLVTGGWQPDAGDRRPGGCGMVWCGTTGALRSPSFIARACAPRSLGGLGARLDRGAQGARREALLGNGTGGVTGECDRVSATGGVTRSTTGKRYEGAGPGSVTRSTTGKRYEGAGPAA